VIESTTVYQSTSGVHAIMREIRLDTNLTSEAEFFIFSISFKAKHYTIKTVSVLRDSNVTSLLT
jgi:hypothetical protein